MAQLPALPLIFGMTLGKSFASLSLSSLICKMGCWESFMGNV